MVGLRMPTPFAHLDVPCHSAASHPGISQGGGEMIDEVFLDHSTWAHAPGVPPLWFIALRRAVNRLSLCGRTSCRGPTSGMGKSEQAAECPPLPPSVPNGSSGL